MARVVWLGSGSLSRGAGRFSSDVTQAPSRSFPALPDLDLIEGLELVTVEERLPAAPGAV